MKKLQILFIACSQVMFSKETARKLAEDAIGSMMGDIGKEAPEVLKNIMNRAKDQAFKNHEHRFQDQINVPINPDHITSYEGKVEVEGNFWTITFQTVAGEITWKYSVEQYYTQDLARFKEVTETPNV